MKGYYTTLTDRVDQLFDEAAKQNRPKDWKACQRRVISLVIQECGKSYRNGIRYAADLK